MDLINERKQRRIETQPLEFPSAGSVFRNPDGDFAGRLIEEIGYKGKNVGGAKVSEKHANFIINKDNASSLDVINLITEIKDKVKLIEIQRSKGYSTRKSLNISKIEKDLEQLKSEE